MKTTLICLLIVFPTILIAQELPELTDSTTITEDVIPEESIYYEDSDHPREKYSRNEMHTLSGNHHSGGYGGLVFKGSEFNDESILMIGFRGAWIINRALGIGIDGHGIIPVSKYDNIDPEGLEKAVLVGGYGGFLLEPVLWSNQIVHFTFPVSMGAGWLGYVQDWEDEWKNEWDYYDGELYDQDVFWYIEPGINVEINVARFFRIGAGISKRFTQNLNLISTPDSAFDNLNYGFILKFGGF